MTDMTDIDMTDIKPAQDYPVLPDGEYTMFMSKSEKKENSKKTGSFLALEFIVVGGQYDNAKIFHNLNLWNPSDIAVNIAKSEWLVLCQAIKGVPAVKDSGELHDKKFVGTLAIEERKDKDGKSHEPKKFGNTLVCKENKVRSMNGQSPNAQAATQGATGSNKNAATSSKKTPW